MTYVEDHQYLVGMFNGGKRHPVSWKIGWWVNEHQEHERVIEAVSYTHLTLPTTDVV